MFFTLISHKLGCGEGQSWCNDSLDPEKTIVTILLQGNQVTNVGSFAKLRKRHTFSIEPFSSKSCLKNRAVSIFTCRIRCVSIRFIIHRSKFTPIAANTMAKLSSWSSNTPLDWSCFTKPPCRQIIAAI